MLDLKTKRLFYIFNGVKDDNVYGLVDINRKSKL